MICIIYLRGFEVFVNREGKLMKMIKKNIFYDLFFNFCFRLKVKDVSGKFWIVVVVNVIQIVIGIVLKDNEMVKINILNSKYRFLYWFLYYDNRYCMF